MKIYTKTGDKGTASLLGGTRVVKYHTRLECYGTIDELNSHLGLLYDLLEGNSSQSVISKIQHVLFAVGSYLANEKPNDRTTPLVQQSDIELLEREIDAYTVLLPELKNFILPAGHPTASHSHIARTVCRRAERCIVKLSEEIEIHANIISYINRLSDFLFVLARKIVYDNNKIEIKWTPSL